MKFIKKIYHFAGSIYFALVLIASTALMVIAGTFIESKTESHRYAAYLTYHHPLFKALLWGFFINILISALRRWPFKWRHIPFLITHLGLLMILGGVLIKNYWGKQGSMSVMEGSGSQKIFEMEQAAIAIEGKNSPPELFELKRDLRGHFPPVWRGKNELQIEVLEYLPHAKEQLQSWVKGDKVYLKGLPPLSLIGWKKGDPLQVAGRIRLVLEEIQPWEIFAYRTENGPELLRQIFSHELQVVLFNRLEKKKEDLIPEVELQVNPKFDDPKALVHLAAKPPRKVEIPLSGSRSLLNHKNNSQFYEHGKYAIDLIRKHPALVILVTPDNETTLIALDQYGEIYTLDGNAIDSIIVYDKGYGGYAVQAEIPLGWPSVKRESKELAQKELLAEQLRQGIGEERALSPPLLLFKESCLQLGLDFPNNFAEFLFLFDQTESWLYPRTYPLPQPFNQIFSNWHFNQLSEAEIKACYWTVALFDELETALIGGEPLMPVLKKKGWPLLSELAKIDSRDNKAISEALTHQIFSAASSLPEIPADSFSNEEKARLYSAYLRANAIHLSSLDLAIPPISRSSFLLETPLSVIQKKEPAGIKLEENLPKITLRVTQDGKSELISLGYDRSASGLKWPVLDGNYLLRFQPLFKEIPYRIRLRQARQLNYTQTSQPYSFESDLIITDLNSLKSEEKTISMNHVHETWDGYRFYLSNISSSQEHEVKRIQLVINHDPAKYWLTYPGALIMSLGIFLLFWMRPYQFKPNMP